MATRSALDIARAVGTAPTRAALRRRSDAGPMAAWRTCAPGRLRSGDAARIERLLATTSILREPQWEAARAGDTAAAVAVAIRQVRSCRADSASADLALSNLLLVAERGAAGAGPVMDLALRTLARRRAGDRRLMRLAALWARPRRRVPRRRP